jgi:hypothetical protein
MGRGFRVNYLQIISSVKTIFLFLQGRIEKKEKPVLFFSFNIFLVKWIIRRRKNLAGALVKHIQILLLLSYSISRLILFGFFF